jgi:hypothetical protein
MVGCSIGYVNEVRKTLNFTTENEKLTNARGQTRPTTYRKKKADSAPAPPSKPVPEPEPSSTESVPEAVLRLCRRTNCLRRRPARTGKPDLGPPQPATLSHLETRGMGRAAGGNSAPGEPG